MIPTRIPYPGLRPFERSESDIFFGREEQTDQLLRTLENKHFLAVVGPSGCGKSSLVRAGMIAGLETGYMAKAGARWRVATMRPGASPFRKLAAALLDNAALGPERQGHEGAVAFLEATLRRGPLGLLGVLRETPLPPGTNLLLLVDQFEEVFRFRASTDHDEADAFVALLLSSTQQESRIYVVLTLRSDYIGDCAVFSGLPEALNQSQYLTPRLTREQRHFAIVGPARVFGGDVEPQLVNRILNEMGPEPNLLPVFQHLLMRMWTYDRSGRAEGKASRATEGHSTPKPVLDAPLATRTASTRDIGSSAAAVLMVAEPQATTSGRILTLHDYDAVGGFANALSNHANEVFDSLNEDQRKTATLLFRWLCERGGQLRDVRRPTPLHEITELPHLSLDEVTPVADAFRRPDHCFLTPSFPEPLVTETVLDITHESLIRQWDRLNKWVELERESARTYRFLAETASLWKEGKAALWGTPNLDEAIYWQQRENPTKEWAKRYGGDFELAKKFLEASRQKRDAELAEAKAQQERRLRRANRLIAALTLTVVTLVVGILIHRYLHVWDYKADYRSFEKAFGEPGGIGQLTSSQVHHRAVSIRIIRKGRWGRVTEMQAINSRGELTPLNAIATYLRPGDEDSPPFHECDWRFAYDSQGRIANETAYNKLGKMVWGFVYSPSQEKNTTSRDGYYLGPDGYPKPEKGSAASFVHVEYSQDGYQRRILYRDRLANPMPGLDRAFGREMIYDNEGRMTELKSLDPHGNAMNDEFGNSILRMTYDQSGNQVGAKAYEAAGLPVVVREGWSQSSSRYDENGNEIEISYFDETGKPTLHKDGYHRQTMTYDERGQVKEERFWDITGKPAVLSDGYHGTRSTYDDYGFLLQTTYVDSDGRPIQHKFGFATVRSTYDGQNREIERTFFDADGKPVASTDGYYKVMFQYADYGKPTEVTYFDNDGRQTESVNGYARFTSEYDAHDNLIRVATYDSDGHPTTGKDRCASKTFKYDDRSNKTDEAYFGVDGKPTDAGNGYFRWHFSYDQRGNDIKDEFFDPAGNPVVNKNGYARITYEYDQVGHKTRATYLGLHSEPVRSNKDEVAGWISEYDSAGNETRRAYFDPNNRPAVLKGAGYASFEATFDRGKHRTELTFFDLKHQLVMSSDGYAVLRKKYDPRGNVIEEAFFDANRKLTLAGGEKEYARVVHQYDERGDQVESSYFGIDNNPIRVKLGYHAERGTFDDHHNAVEFTYFGLHGEPIETLEGFARRVQHVDKYGNTIDEAIFKLNGTPISVGGCSQHVNRYDARQRLIEERCVGLDGHLAFRTEGFALRQFQYDERGNRTEVAYFGTRGEPIRGDQKTQHKVKSVYDSHDNKIEETYFDIDGRPIVGAHLKNGEYELCKRWTGRYDPTGKLVQAQCIL